MVLGRGRSAWRNAGARRTCSIGVARD
jgi:hypothetical protein